MKVDGRQVAEMQLDQGVGQERGCCDPHPFAVCLICTAVRGQTGWRVPLTLAALPGRWRPLGSFQTTCGGTSA